MAALPRGRTLPEEVWLRRHRWMTLLVWSQALELLTALECSHAQGFHYARPLAAAELAQLLATEAFGELAS